MSKNSNLPLDFYFTIKDPECKVASVEVPSVLPDNKIIHSFVRTPIYDFTNKMIGYKVSDDYVQQVSKEKYIVRISNTYSLNERGTISWQYAFENKDPTIYYPVNELAASNITATTGEFYGKTGKVSLFPKPDGSRLVNVTFN